MPKKILACLEELGITGIVNGYFTITAGETVQERAKGQGMTAFTCWNSRGGVACVLVKPRKKPWKLK